MTMQEVQASINKHTANEKLVHRVIGDSRLGCIADMIRAKYNKRRVSRKWLRGQMMTMVSARTADRLLDCEHARGYDYNIYWNMIKIDILAEKIRKMNRRMMVFIFGSEEAAMKALTKKEKNNGES